MNILRKLFPAKIEELGRLLGYAYGAIERYQEQRMDERAAEVWSTTRDVLPLLLEFRPYLPPHKQLLVDIVARAKELELSTGELILVFDRTVDELHVRLERERDYAEANAPWTRRLLDILDGRRQLPGDSRTPRVLPAVEAFPTFVASGLGASPGQAAGPVHLFVKGGEPPRVPSVIVARMTSTDIVEWMDRVRAIATDQGGRVCHAAVVAREFDVPCVVGCGNLTELLDPGEVVLVDGDTGVIMGR